LTLDQGWGKFGSWINIPDSQLWSSSSNLGCPQNGKKNFGSNRTNRKEICFGCVSVCFVKPKTKIFGLFRFVSVFRTYIETTETNRTVSNQTETTRNNPKFSEKIPKYALFQTVSVGLLFVSVQLKHRNSLFGKECETTETNCFEQTENKPKPPETTQNFLKNYQYMLSIKLCFGWCSICFGSIETPKLFVSVKKRNNRNKHFVSGSAETTYQPLCGVG
jgi:hypothetical protein